MSHFFTLAKMRTEATGRMHVVVQREHGISVVSERIALLANYTRVI